MGFWPDIHKPFAVGPMGPPLCLGPIPGNGGAVGDFDNKDSVLPTHCALKMDPSLIHPASPEGIGRYVATTNNLRRRGRGSGGATRIVAAISWTWGGPL